MNLSFCACILVTLCHLASFKEIFLNYGQENDTVQIFKYFHDVENGFWAEFGAYNPIKYSNTMGLYAQGWNGVSIEASPTRIVPFNYIRPSCINVLSAIGYQDTFATLYEMNAHSTIIEKVKDFDVIKWNKGVEIEVNIPSMSMKQICERFFQKRPLFLSLDVESMEPVAVLLNDWENPLCRPDIIYSEVVESNKYSGLPQTQQVMKDKNYTKLPQLYFRNEVFIANQKFDEYMLKYKKGQALLAQKKVQQFFDVIDELCKHLGLEVVDRNNYSLKEGSVYLHFAQRDQYISLRQLEKKNLDLAQDLNVKRPIVIFHFNPLNSFLMAPHKNYKVESISLRNPESLKFKKITLFGDNPKKYTELYVFDHQYSGDQSSFPIIVPGETDSHTKIQRNFVNNVNMQKQLQNIEKQEIESDKEGWKEVQREKGRKAEHKMERNFEAQTEKVFGELGETENESTVVKMGVEDLYTIFFIFFLMLMVLLWQIYKLQRQVQVLARGKPEQIPQQEQSLSIN